MPATARTPAGILLIPEQGPLYMLQYKSNKLTIRATTEACYVQGPRPWHHETFLDVMRWSICLPFFFILALILAFATKVATVLAKLPTAIIISNNPQATTCSPQPKSQVFSEKKRLYYPIYCMLPERKLLPLVVQCCSYSCLGLKGTKCFCL